MITMVDLKYFTPKNFSVVYTKIFDELYNWKNCG